MARTLAWFDCADDILIGTLDEAPGRTGLLIVSGGNEIRIGAHRGMATLAQRVAAAGHPVFRFDRRGIGDSSGINGGFESSGPDIAAAAEEFRALQPQLARIVAFGNCDAATALALFHQDTPVDALVLANPWTIDRADAEPDARDADLPPPAAIRARYLAKLKRPREWWRLLRGRIDLGRLWRGLRRARKKPGNELAERLGKALASATVPVTVLIARGDNSALAFRAALPRVAVTECDTASHSFADADASDWLFERIVESLRSGTEFAALRSPQ